MGGHNGDWGTLLEFRASGNHRRDVRHWSDPPTRLPTPRSGRKPGSNTLANVRQPDPELPQPGRQHRLLARGPRSRGHHLLGIGPSPPGFSGHPPRTLNTSPVGAGSRGSFLALGAAFREAQVSTDRREEDPGTHRTILAGSQAVEAAPPPRNLAR